MSNLSLATSWAQRHLERALAGLSRTCHEVSAPPHPHPPQKLMESFGAHKDTFRSVVKALGLLQTNAELQLSF